MSGYFLMERGWQTDPVFRSEVFSRRDAWAWLMEDAAYRDQEKEIGGQIVIIRRGQVFRPIRYLAKAWRWDEKRVRRFLESVRKAGKTAAATVSGRLVITICNYDEIQRIPTQAAAPTVPDEAKTAAPPPQIRIKEELKELNLEDGSTDDTAGSNERYAFAGKVIRLNHADLDRWRTQFHAIPDLVAELWALDAWYADGDEKRGKGWFHRAQTTFARKHQDWLTKAKESDSGSNVVPLNGTAFAEQHQRGIEEQLRRDREEDEAAARRRAT